MTEAGARVGAILRADEKQVEFLGFGVYEGDKLRPNWREEAQAFLPTARSVNASEATKSLDDWLDWHTGWNNAARQHRPDAARTDDEVRALAEASFKDAQDRLTWTDEQVIEGMKTTSMFTNPCIKLDSGAVVWGMECWWDKAEHVESWLNAKKAAGVTVTTVTLDPDRFGPADETT